MRWLTIPNLMTLLRLLLSAPLVYFILEGRTTAALVVCIIGILSDLDGTVARLTKSVTKTLRDRHGAGRMTAADLSCSIPIHPQAETEARTYAPCPVRTSKGVVGDGGGRTRGAQEVLRIQFPESVIGTLS